MPRLLTQACRAAGSQKAWAEANGVTGSYVNDVLQARREPGDSILNALGLVKVVGYVERRKKAEAA